MRIWPEDIKPVDPAGAPLADGAYVLDVTDDVVTMVPDSGGGGSLDVEDEGVSEATGVTTLNFTGAGVTATDAGGGVVDVDIPGGGGGGGSGQDRRWNVGSTETTIDEFDDDSLAGAWVRVDGTGAASGNVDYSEGADTLAVRNNGGDTADKLHGLVIPLSSHGGSLANGDGFVTCVTLLGAPVNHCFAGMIISDGTTHGSGNQVWAEVGRNAGTDLIVQSFGWSGWGTAGSAAGGFLWARTQQTALYVRLALISANTWRTDISVDGHHWLNGSATLSKTMTATHVGFASTSYGTSTKHIASYEFLRRVSGVT